MPSKTPNVLSYKTVPKPSKELNTLPIELNMLPTKLIVLPMILNGR